MFRLLKIKNGRINQGEPVKLPANAEKYSIGMALVLEDGALTPCAPNVKPTYICCEMRDSELAYPITAYPVSPDMAFECEVVGDASALNLGDKVALTADACGVNAAASGPATILDLSYIDKGKATVHFQ